MERTIKYLAKAHDLAYDDGLKEFDTIWCVKCLNAIRNIIVVTWEFVQKMGIIT